MCFCVLVQRKLSVESNNKKEKENTVLSENKIEAHIKCDIPLVLVMSVSCFFYLLDLVS